VLGAFSKVTQIVSLEALKKAIKEKFAGEKEKFIEKNIQALIKGYESANEG
jgi:Pyruvate/2-oxoacid:ferredoxin oxidoreductase gamma subunit